MRTRILSTLLPLAAGLPAVAQITITAAGNVAAIGDTFTYNKAAYAPAPPGGADVLFDHSGLISTGTTQFLWMDTAAYSHGSHFPSAQMAVTNDQDTVFYAVTAAGLERVGELNHMTVGNPIDLEIVHTNSLLDLQLPLTYGGTWSDQVVGSVSASDGSSGGRSGLLQGTADGYGYVVLPGQGPLPVLRVHTLLQETIDIPIGGNPTSVSHKHRGYDYYVPWLKMPVLSIWTDTLAITTPFPFTLPDNGIRYMSADPVGMVETSKAPMELGLWPNPAEGASVVAMARATGDGASLRVLDTAGRLVRLVRLPQGIQRWTLAADELPAGCYAVTVTDNDGVHGTARLVKR